MPVANNPLSNRDFTEINRALKQNADAREAIELAKAAGVPCDEADERCQLLMKQLMALKATYFPERP